MVIPYTYMIGWSSLNLWYYGRRTAKGCHPNELWKTYFTSSKYVSKTRKDLGEPDIVQVRKIFDNVLECCEWEVTVLRRLKVLTSDKWLNKAVGATWILESLMGSMARNTLKKILRGRLILEERMETAIIFKEKRIL